MVCNYVDVSVVYNYVDATVDSVHSSVKNKDCEVSLRLNVKV